MIFIWVFRLMLSLLSNQPLVTCLTETDFKHWFQYAATLMNLMTEDSLQSFITNEIFDLAIQYADPKLIMSLFVKSKEDVQQSVIEDILYHFAVTDEYDNFVNLVQTEIRKPKLFANGETLFTSLIKKKNLKYCWEIINCEPNKKCTALPNSRNETPLQISIEMELFDLMTPLIFNCAESDIEVNWHAPLIPLLQKLSKSNNVFGDYFRTHLMIDLECCG